MRYKFLKKQKHVVHSLNAQPRGADKPRANKRKFLISALFLLGLAGLVYFIVWGSFWQVQHIEVSGSQKADLMVDLVRIVRDYQQGVYYRFIPRQNILFLDIDDLAGWIKQRLLVDELRIDKKIPDRLIIKVKEKRPVLIWQKDREYYYVDKQGVVMSAKKLAEIKYDLPIVSSLDGAEVIVGRQLLRTEQVSYIREVVNWVKDEFSAWYIEKVVLPAVEGREMFFYNNQGWYFILSLDTDKQIALNNLALFVKQKADRLADIEYIDLRIEDRLFYK